MRSLTSSPAAPVAERQRLIQSMKIFATGVLESKMSKQKVYIPISQVQVLYIKVLNAILPPPFPHRSE